MHTKKPWLIQQGLIFGPNIHGQLIAKAIDRASCNQTEADMASQITIDEACANLDLIAAAPDLLDACESTVELWERWAERSEFLKEPLRESVRMRVDECRRAIKKARGE